MAPLYKVFEDDEVSKTTVEAHMAQAQLLDSAKFIITGVIEVFSDSERAAVPADKISAHLLCRGRSSVSLSIRAAMPQYEGVAGFLTY